MRNKVIAAIVVVAIVAGGGWWFTKRSTNASAKAQVQYRFEKVQRGQISNTISGTGPVASVNGVMVKSNQTGTVTQILAQDGDKVKAGQVVIVLDNDNLESSLKQAQVDVQNNQQSLENLLNPQSTAVRAQQLKVESAKLTLKQRQTDVANLTVTAPIGGVIASVKTTAGSSITANTLLFTIYDDSTPTFTASIPQRDAALIKVGQKASVELAGFGKVTGTVVENAAAATPTSGNRDANVPVQISLPSLAGVRAGMVGQTSIEIDGLSYLVVANGSIDNDAVEVRAQVAGIAGSIGIREGSRVKAGDVLLRLVNDSLTVSLAQAENDLATQEQALVNLVDPANDPSGQLRQLRNKLDQAQITLATRQSDFNDLSVKAPVEGQISALTARVGDRVTANQSLFRVANYNLMQITITVDELDVAKAKVGQKTQITLDALPGRNYLGTVTKINPEGTFRNDIATFEVTVTVDKPDGLMAGMNSTVTIIVDDKQGLYLPAATVQVRQGRAFVQVLENGQPVQKEVQVGLRTSQRVEITGGLKEGDEVISVIIRPTSTTQGLGGLFGGGNRQQGTNTTFPQEQAPAGAGQRQQQQGGFRQGGTGTGTGGR